MKKYLWIVLAGVLLIALALSLTSTYGIKRSYRSESTSVSFSYPFRWAVEEKSEGSAKVVSICNEKDEATETACWYGVRIEVYPSQEEWLKTVAIPAQGTEPAKSFASWEDYRSYAKEHHWITYEYAPRTIGGMNAEVYDTSIEVSNGHRITYQFTAQGRYYRILVPSASPPDSMTHGQQVVIDSLKLK